MKLITALIHFCLFKRVRVGYDECTFPCEIMTTLKCLIQGGNHLHGQLCTLLKSVYTHAHILGGVITRRKINTRKNTRQSYSSEVTSDININTGEGDAGSRFPAKRQHLLVPCARYFDFSVI